MCVSTQGTFGSQCDDPAQCNLGLICSNDGICLFDRNEKCSSKNDCANFLICQSNGKCGCDTLVSTYSAINGNKIIKE